MSERSDGFYYDSNGTEWGWDSTDGWLKVIATVSSTPSDLSHVRYRL